MQLVGIQIYNIQIKITCTAKNEIQDIVTVPVGTPVGGTGKMEGGIASKLRYVLGGLHT